MDRARMMRRLRNRRLRSRPSGWFIAAALVYAGALLGAGLWPYDFQTRCNDCENGATAAPGVPGFRFAQEGMVIDDEGGRLLHARLSGASGITVAVVARSDALFQQGPARIVSLSAGADERNLTIGQVRSGLEFRLRTPGTGRNGSRPHTRAAGVVWPGETALFVATYDMSAFRIFADGALAAERPLDAGPLTGWDPDFTLLFGNETTGDRPWRGHLFDVAIYDQAFDPARAAALTPGDLAAPVPERVYHLATRRRMGACRIPARYANDHKWDRLGFGHRTAGDILMNAAAWTPLGFLAALALGAGTWRRGLLAMAVIAGFAATVEIGQSSLFSRTSSAFDLAAGLSGAALGLVLAGLRTQRRPRF